MNRLPRRLPCRQQPASFEGADAEKNFRCVLAAGLEAQDSSTVNFNRDVLPILRRIARPVTVPGNSRDVFPDVSTDAAMARAMKTAVVSRKMPPWFADPQFGHFLNDRALKQTEIETIAKWADSGAAQGEPKDAPPLVTWPEGWQIQPDIIVEGPTTNVPAHPKNDVIECMSVTVPSGFKE